MAYALRLGNECDTYGEWLLSQTVFRDRTGVELRAGFMLSYRTGTSAVGEELTGQNQLRLQQSFVSATFPQLGGARLWGGLQYFRRETVDPLDFFFLDTSEPGAGVEEVDLGFGRLAVSVFQTRGRLGEEPRQRAYWRPDVRVYGMPINRDGALEVDVNAVLVSRPVGAARVPGEGAVGGWITVEHTQTGIGNGGYHKLVLQLANGPAAEMGPGPPRSTRRSNRQVRVIEQLLLQPGPRVAAMGGGTFADVKRDGAREVQWGAFVRPVVYVGEYLKLTGSAGDTQVRPQGRRPRGFFQATFAPAISPPPAAEGAFFVRPELRLFVTWAAWNAAAAAAPEPPGGGAFGAARQGLNYGAQVEVWF
jgi:maltoporin